MRLIARRLPLSAAALMLIGGQVGQQDVVAYMLSQKDAPRYMARIVAAPYGESMEPTFVYSREDGSAKAGRGAQVALAGSGEFEHLGLAEAKVDLSVETLSVRTGKAGKGDLLADVKPALAERDLGAGSVATAVSLLSAGSSRDFPRVSFVQPRVFDGAGGAQSLLAAASTGVENDADAAAAGARFMAAASAATSASLVSAYAPAGGVDLNAPFESLLGAPGTAKAPGPLDHWWSDRPLPKEVRDERQVKCLAEAIYFEARSESRLGQMGVAQVVMNRVKNPAYPDTICGVVYQNKSWFNRCQFSFACDRVRDVVRDQHSWSTAMEIAEGYTNETMWLPEIGASTHYHATYVKPKWAPTMKRLERIGDHVFYLTFGGDWT
ncbi:cell wall hydrolase [Amorphus orientalis]|uniref:Spore germination cell wall hydrolase CwlJ-like protein n=1 Tax=Amorphus orientalis TaxID=649198 RepID=A0AAE3VQF5_9HYPH|nr:cell wall hydrolase [Amorphus orientalis]MDQ0315861.1 spore germination cell wall hydrolase CwlJ-like protein [Amorphus orientalis]